jgi:hypothetical protein
MINRHARLEMMTIIINRLRIETAECLSIAIRAIHRTGIIMSMIAEKIIRVFDLRSMSKLYLSGSGMKNERSLFNMVHLSPADGLTYDIIIKHAE